MVVIRDIYKDNCVNYISPKCFCLWCGCIFSAGYEVEEGFSFYREGNIDTMRRKKSCGRSYCNLCIYYGPIDSFSKVLACHCVLVNKGNKSPHLSQVKAMIE